MADLQQIARQHGILPSYRDIWGNEHRPSPTVQEELIAAMGVDVGGLLQRSTSGNSLDEVPMLSSVCVLSPACRSIEVRIPTEVVRSDAPITWTLHQEDGHVQRGSFLSSQQPLIESNPVSTLTRWTVPADLPLGYHDLTLSLDHDDTTASTRLVCCPGQCYLPQGLLEGGRVWGPSVNLYGLRSHQSFGVGDFGDLMPLIQFAARHGANIIGLNPLHALHTRFPELASPYSPSNRLFLNYLYLNIREIAETQRASEILSQVEKEPTRSTLATLRSSDLVDYSAVSRLKLEMLQQLFSHFEKHVVCQSDEMARQYQSFVDRGGPALRYQALFEAIDEAFGGESVEERGWPYWPPAFRNPESDAVQTFAKTNRERVDFWLYVQWQLDRQLATVASVCADAGQSIGIYRDLAVSADPCGAETWTNQGLFALGASVGAPPDALAPQGQNWGLPPLVPHALQERAYRHFSALLSANMRHAGALRVDHVMGLKRLFWIPEGREAAEGAYVCYPFHDLLAILALESHRNRCLVIGEDLGTVPDEVRDAMEQWNILSYKVLLFERGEDGEVKRPEAYPNAALVTGSTHDLPTLAGYWRDRDIEWRDRLNLYPTEDVRRWQLDERHHVRGSLIRALVAHGLLAGSVSDELPPYTDELCRALNIYLARSPAQVLMVQLEDAVGQVDQVNLPGTILEYPNWRRKLALSLEDAMQSSSVIQLFDALKRERG